MKILFTNISDIQPIPPPEDLIRADANVSVPLALILKKRGHDVFFLCPKSSTIKVKKIFTSTNPFRSIISGNELYSIANPSLRTTMIMSLQMDIYLRLIEACRKEKFDLVHVHTNNPLAELIVAKEVDTPFVFTVHGICLYPELESRLKKLFRKKENYFVSISNYQRKSYPGLKFTKTIYNGLELARFPFSAKGGNNLLFTGRLKKTKGIGEAVEVVEKAQKKLDIIGAFSMEELDRNYVQDRIMEKVKRSEGKIKYHGTVKRSEVPSFYGRSKATVFPIQWEEPFGLVMIESMACGTPVVAFARGSVPEIVKDGQTGFIVNSSPKDVRGNWLIKKTGIAGMVEAVKRIYGMPKKDYLELRENCRALVEEKFTAERMVSEYEKTYNEILI
ncbi:MAG: group 1 glycosyl transferase [Parcubacteria group bacterium Gr01-1014_30]|nr:MAG: group 1 glycosyl transferase [Parcubacteria group bacterium Gr01-1014_30]